jgi:sialate O-acetylesterase
MVLQRNMEVTIWGWAEPGERVCVGCDWQKDASYDCVTDGDGKWQVKVTTPKAGGPYTISVTGRNKLTLRNVLVGEVWVCSGQSNMKWRVKNSANPEREIASARHPNIRLFNVEETHAAAPQPDCEGSWAVCSPKMVEDFSAVAYYFGRSLHKELNVPIGLIETAWGGTLAEAWTRWEILVSDPDLKPITERFDEAWAKYLEAIKDYAQELTAWASQVELACEKAAPRPPEPKKPKSPEHHNAPSRLYNGMIAPLIPYGIRGAIWYQGESNVSRAYQYRKLFPAMIQNWRTDWGQGEFPFYYVQIAPWKYNDKLAAAELRVAQLMAMAVPNTGMVVTTDIGDVQDIHPKNKQEVGRRLALWALAKTYGRDGVAYSGPIYRSMGVKGDKIRLSFDHTFGGLVAKDGPLTHFEIAGTDKDFVEAKAVIDGDTVVVSSNKVAEPVAVRYGWSNTAQPNLFNDEGLPASPFRTDDWPAMTAGTK